MKKSKIVRMLAYAAVISSLALAGFGCKKQESKVENAPGTPAVQAPAEQASQGQATVGTGPLSSFMAEIAIINPPATLKANAMTTVEVKIKNTSNSLWPAKGQTGGKFMVHPSYHWLDKNGKAVVADGHRTDLPSDVEPGKEVTINAKVQAPKQPGDYILEVDMLQEFVSWFAPKKSPTARVNVTVN